MPVIFDFVVSPAWQPGKDFCNELNEKIYKIYTHSVKAPNSTQRFFSFFIFSVHSEIFHSSVLSKTPKQLRLFKLLLI